MRSEPRLGRTQLCRSLSGRITTVLIVVVSIFCSRAASGIPNPVTTVREARAVLEALSLTKPRMARSLVTMTREQYMRESILPRGTAILNALPETETEYLSVFRLSLSASEKQRLLLSAGLFATEGVAAPRVKSAQTALQELRARPNPVIIIIAHNDNGRFRFPDGSCVGVDHLLRDANKQGKLVCLVSCNGARVARGSHAGMSGEIAVVEASNVAIDLAWMIEAAIEQRRVATMRHLLGIETANAPRHSSRANRAAGPVREEALEGEIASALQDYLDAALRGSRDRAHVRVLKRGGLAAAGAVIAIALEPRPDAMNATDADSCGFDPRGTAEEQIGVLHEKTETLRRLVAPYAYRERGNLLNPKPEVPALLVAMVKSELRCIEAEREREYYKRIRAGLEAVTDDVNAGVMKTLGWRGIQKQKKEIEEWYEELLSFVAGTQANGIVPTTR